MKKTSSRLAQFAICTSVAALCAGCGTIGAHLFDNPHQGYAGVCADGRVIGRGQPVAILDLPFSFAADTLLLPVDLWPQTKNPLREGWTFRPLAGTKTSHQGQSTNQLEKAIVDDYQSFIAKNQLYPMSSVTGFYEDGKGQRAVEFEAYQDHDSRHYVLIYNKENKRIKVVIFGHHRYMC